MREELVIVLQRQQTLGHQLFNGRKVLAAAITLSSTEKMANRLFTQLRKTGAIHFHTLVCSAVTLSHSGQGAAEKGCSVFHQLDYVLVETDLVVVQLFDKCFQWRNQLTEFRKVSHLCSALEGMQRSLQ